MGPPGRPTLQGQGDVVATAAMRPVCATAVRPLGRATVALGPPARPTLQGQGADAVAGWFVLDDRPVAPNAVGAVMTAAARSAPISIVALEMFIVAPALLVSAGL